MHELQQKQQQLKNSNSWIDYICFSDDLPQGVYTRRGKVLRIIPTKYKNELLKQIPDRSLYGLPPISFIGSVEIINIESASNFLAQNL